MNITPSLDLEELINDFYESNFDVDLTSLCTPDGFEIHQASTNKFQSTTDTVAAIASTLSSISKSIANEIINSPFKATIIEAEQGNFVCVYTQYLQKNVVLTIYAREGMSVGELHVKTKNLAKSISKLLN